MATKPGNITLSQNRKYLVDSTDKPFFWLADTWWYGLTDRAAWPRPFQNLVQKRLEQGFTVIQLVVGVAPEIEISSRQAAAEGEMPFLTSSKPNPKYFDAIEKKIRYIINAGLIPCLLGGWGDQLDQIGYESMKAFWEMMLERFEKYPIIWCLTGEVDIIRPEQTSQLSVFKKIETKFHRIPLAVKLFFNPIKSMFRVYRSRDLKRRLQLWSDIASMIKKRDPDHLLLVHPHAMVPASSLLTNPNLIDVESIQSGHSLDRKAFMVTAARQHSKNKPFINLEPWYEGIMGDFDDRLQRYAFWMSILSGAKGHSYGADGLWNMRKVDDQFLGHWGNQSWEHAITLPGAQQLGEAKQWLEQFEWWTLQGIDCFDPAWNPKQPDRPVGAQAGNDLYICYFPDVMQLSKATFIPPGSWEKTYYSPETLKQVTKPETQADLLMVVRRK